MRRAEKEEFTLRRVEFLGLTFTRDELVRGRMVRFKEHGRMVSFNEGDLFSRRKLVQSLRNVSKLRSEIYPVRLSDVSLRLNESEQTVDLLICFKPKRR
jgi:DNA-directed RNA polymerase subunit E'/Rpb7